MIVTPLKEFHDTYKADELEQEALAIGRLNQASQRVKRYAKKKAVRVAEGDATQLVRDAAEAKIEQKSLRYIDRMRGRVIEDQEEHSKRMARVKAVEDHYARERRHFDSFQKTIRDLKGGMPRSAAPPPVENWWETNVGFQAGNR